MNSTNRKSPGARGIPRPFNRQTVHAPQSKPVVAQLKTGVSAQSIKQPVAPPVYRPQQVPKVLQTKSSSAQSPLRSATQSGSSPLKHHVNGARPNVLQMTCNCGKAGRASNKHKNSCPEHPNNKKAKAIKVKKVHEDSQSIKNLYSYDSEWAKKRGITEEMIKAFVKHYGKIHGHATSRADKDAERHANTTQDIEQFHKWYNENYQQ